MSNDKVAATVHPRKPCSCFARDPKMGPWHYSNCAYFQALPEESTGEQTWAKIAEDDLYATAAMPWTSQFKVGDQLTAAQRARWVSEDPDGYFAWVRLEAAEAAHLYQDFAPKRDWTPTKGELAFAMGIVLFIIVIFCFIVVAY